MTRLDLTGLKCPLSGAFWGAGNILLGGGGSDTLEGRGGDDIIDGDAYVSVRLSVRTDPDDPASEIGSAASDVLLLLASNHTNGWIGIKALPEGI